MTVSKIRRAQVGTAAERLLLVRDTNRLVSVAAVKSPAMRENEAVLISASRNVGEEVLREIARNREFTRNYQVKLNLSRNPRCPFSFSARIIPLLRDNDSQTWPRAERSRLGAAGGAPAARAQARRQVGYPRFFFGAGRAAAATDPWVTPLVLVSRSDSFSSSRAGPLAAITSRQWS